ncbi:MAG: tRNA (adenosine(37)-N6)-threonylcarbamoyltransferase complex transferase subunit TsaD [Chlamydiia bacterium]
MICLGIESTCDETSIAVVNSNFEILSNVIYSQIPLHSKFGGVFPELAAREHVEKISSCYEEALAIAGIKPEEIDLIAVAYGPGLIGSIQIGLTFAKTLSLLLGVPFVAVNHVHAHLIAPLLDHKEAFPLFPAIGMVLSGGHTQINYMQDPLHVETIGSTIDDAIGECFDKCGKLCNLPYPGGPHVERLALKGDRSQVSLKSCRVKEKPLSFSYSGLKTQVLYALKDPKVRHEDLLASFQHTVFTDLVKKARKAVAMTGAKAIFMGGGVASSQTLRKYFLELECPVFFPSKDLSLDNGAMIGGLGLLQMQAYGPSAHDIEPKTRILFPTPSILL